MDVESKKLQVTQNLMAALGYPVKNKTVSYPQNY